jgi:hypothetical protein
MVSCIFPEFWPLSRNQAAKHAPNSARNAMSGLMPPSVSTRKASGTVMSAIRPRHPLRKRCLQFVNYNEMIAAAEEKSKRRNGAGRERKQAAVVAAIIKITVKLYYHRRLRWSNTIFNLILSTLFYLYI